MAEHDLTLPWHNDDPYPDVIVDSNGVEVASCDCNEDCADMHPDNAGIARALSAARATLAVVGSPRGQS